ncbi:type II toxin-antitoxin system RelE/ParE family toxin [Neogemmobacter tilapiae]|uniref:Toxin Y4kP n=1 Tax=Neogemmobacter tilapiae TaxID=875041 RepID=A0A918TQH6_9RHOB|nr:type II toxin-antitoxin system RelE/ParE family toxin [Gemmobacter tilapiae]GHC54806.1 toxin Y4kP [Gemmobacter tilapiae]
MTGTLPVVFSDRSRDRLRAIQGHIAFHNIRAAERVMACILAAAEMLGDHPELGMLWQNGPTRALSVPGLPYRIHYRVVRNQRIEVITVAHNRQLPPKAL